MTTEREDRAAEMRDYREMLIAGILEMQPGDTFTREYLEKRSTRALERIFDNV